jgi:hypothetical protein
VANVLKNIVVVAGVLLLSAVIYFVVSDHQPLRENVFDRSLQLLGQQLLSLLPEGAERQIVAAKWQQLIERAQRGEIQPAQVERMAVGILNASNLDTKISAEDAEIILNLAYEDANQLAALAAPAVAQPPEVKTPTFSRDELQQKLHEVGKKLETVCLFNSKIKSSCETDPLKQRIFSQNLRYEISNGIRLQADTKLKHELDSKNFQLWKQELKKLEEERLLAWQQNFAEQLAIQQEKLNAHLDSLKVIIEIQQTQAMQYELAAVAAKLEELKKLEKLQQWRVVQPLLVQKIVVKSLNAIDPKAAVPNPPAPKN